MEAVVIGGYTLPFVLETVEDVYALAWATTYGACSAKYSCGSYRSIAHVPDPMMRTMMAIAAACEFVCGMPMYAHQVGSDVALLAASYDPSCDDACMAWYEFFAENGTEILAAAAGGGRPGAGRGLPGYRAQGPRSRSGGMCSFGGDTLVLLADGSTKKIKDIEAGDVILATDPETGEHGPRIVTHLWSHQDLLSHLELANGDRITTTEDHPYWNATDRQWQQAQQLDPGDLLYAGTGEVLAVGGMDWRSAHNDTAYNLTVNDIHTYYVLAGNTPVLVHNCPDDIPTGPKYENPGHHDPRGGPNPYNPNKAVLPGDASAQFGNSVLVDGTRWTKIGTGKSAVYYRYFDDGNGNWHWSGSTNGVNNRGVQVSIPLDQVPISVRRS